MAKIHVIHNSGIDLKDWVMDREEIMENSPFCSKCKKKDCKSCDSFRYVCNKINSNYLDDEIANLDVKLDNYIIAFAQLSFWDGITYGLKVLKPNVNSIFEISEDMNLYYADGRNVRAKCMHHDGTNHILYRVVKDGVDVRKVEELCRNNGCRFAPHQMSKYTKSLRPYVAKVYGWQ